VPLEDTEGAVDGEAEAVDEAVVLPDSDALVLPVAEAPAVTVPVAEPERAALSEPLPLPEEEAVAAALWVRAAVALPVPVPVALCAALREAVPERETQDVAVREAPPLAEVE